MVTYYYLFCLGWGLLQAAYDRAPVSSEPGTPEELRKKMLSPLWMSNPTFGATLGLLAIAAAIVAPVVGFVILRWWHGILGFLIVKFAVSALVPTSNPFFPFATGSLLVPVAAGLMLTT